MKARNVNQRSSRLKLCLKLCLKARAWNAAQKVTALKGDARTAAQKAKDRNQVGKAKKKHRKSATRGLTLSGKVDARFLKGDARSATQKAQASNQWIAASRTER
jgi:hypothetical protein